MIPAARRPTEWPRRSTILRRVPRRRPSSARASAERGGPAIVIRRRHHDQAMTIHSVRQYLTAAMVAAPFLLVGGASRAQDPGHGYTTADIERGSQLYQLSCASCHGPNGDTVPGLNVFSG